MSDAAFGSGVAIRSFVARTFLADGAILHACVSGGSSGAASSQLNSQEEPMTATVVEHADTNAESIDGSRESLQRRLDAQQATIESLQQTIAAMERRERVTRLLRESDAIDVDAAALLTEIAVSQMDTPDVDAAVAELKQARPYLFRAKRPGNSSGVMAARESDSPRGAAIDRAADQAAESGSRRDLLRYLRLKRSA
jgi:hypothetical protein